MHISCEFTSFKVCLLTVLILNSSSTGPLSRSTLAEDYAGKWTDAPGDNTVDPFCKDSPAFVCLLSNVWHFGQKFYDTPFQPHSNFYN